MDKHYFSKQIKAVKTIIESASLKFRIRRGKLLHPLLCYGKLILKDVTGIVQHLGKYACWLHFLSY